MAELKIVQGNDFVLKVKVTKKVIGGSSAELLPLDEVDNLKVSLVSIKETVLDTSISPSEEGICYARVSGLPVGSYALQLTGRYKGHAIRSCERHIITIVNNNALSNVTPGEYEGEDSYNVDTTVVLFTGVAIDTIDEVKDGDMNAVTSNAVYDAIQAEKTSREAADALKADTSYVNTELAKKANASSLGAKADKSYVDAELAKKVGDGVLLTENDITSEAIKGRHLASNSVTTGKIAPGTILETDINASAFDDTLATSRKLADAKIVGDKISDIASKVSDFTDEIHDAVCPSIEALESDVEEVQGKINAITTTKESSKIVTKEIDVDTDRVSGYFISAGGTIAQNDSLAYSKRIDVKEGDIVRFSYLLGGGTKYYTNMRFVTAYSNGVAVESKGGNNVSQLTIQNGVDYIVVTFYINNAGQTNHCVEITTQESTSAIVLKDYKVIEQARLSTSNSSRWKGVLNGGDVKTLISQNVKNDVFITFSGQITSFSKLRIGVKHGNIVIPYYEIDDTYLAIYRDDGKSWETNPTWGLRVEHGLTMTNNIQIIIETNCKMALKRIILCANGEMFTREADRWIADNNTPYIESVGSSLTNCSFSWSCKNLESKVWMFGDSWFSLYDNVRWTWQAEKLGYLDKCLINGYAGQGSADALVSLKNLLTLGKPKYIVWCLGMNDGDSGSINAIWKSCVEELMSICDQKGIELILYKVPTTLGINNEYKGAYIENSGYRFIDAYSAVGSNSSGAWFDGFDGYATDGNHNHTSQKGAIAVMMQFLADFPEIALQ